MLYIEILAHGFHRSLLSRVFLFFFSLYVVSMATIKILLIKVLGSLQCSAVLNIHFGELSIYVDRVKWYPSLLWQYWLKLDIAWKFYILFRNELWYLDAGMVSLSSEFVNEKWKGRAKTRTEMCMPLKLCEWVTQEGTCEEIWNDLNHRAGGKCKLRIDNDKSKETTTR